MFTLYVAPDRRRPSQYDVGSVVCVRTLESVPEGRVRVVNCATLVRRPDFLRGTPTLVDDETNEVYTGHHALHRLQLLSLYHAEEYGKLQVRRDDGTRRSGAQRRGPTAATEAPWSDPPPAVDDVDGTLWASTIDDTDVAEEAEQSLGGDRKLTSDDLARVMSDRGPPLQSQSLTAAPPPPPPPLSD